MKRFIVTAIIIYANLLTCGYSQTAPTETNLSSLVDGYFYQATKDYLNGDYRATIRNLGLALNANPQDERVSTFMQRVIIEGAKFYYKRKDYQQTIEFLSIGTQIFPQNTEIKQLYISTESILTRVPTTESVPVKKTEVPVLTQPVSIPKSGKDKIPTRRVVSDMSYIPKPTKPISQPVQTKVVTKKPVSTPTDMALSYEIKGKPSSIPTVLLAEEILTKIIAQREMAYARDLKLAIYGIGGIVLLSIIIIAGLLYLSNIKTEFQNRTSNIKQELEHIHQQVQQIRTTTECANPADSTADIVTVLKEVDFKLDNMKTNLVTHKGKSIDREDKNVPFIPNQQNNNTETNVLCERKDLLTRIRGENLAADLLDGDTLELNEARNRMVTAAVSLYQINPHGAVNVLKETISTGNLFAQISAVYALGEIAAFDTVGILNEMLNWDLPVPLKSAVLKTCVRLSRRTDLSDRITELINQTLSQERQKQDWIF